MDFNPVILFCQKEVLCVALMKLFLLFSLLLSSSVKQGFKYQYTIQVEADGLLSDASPPLLYSHMQPYCGDGLIQGSVHLVDILTWLMMMVTNETLKMSIVLDGSLSVGQKSVMTVICWMGMAALRNVTRRLASTVMVSEYHSLQCGKTEVSDSSWVYTQFKAESMSSCGVSFKNNGNTFLLSYIKPTNSALSLTCKYTNTI